MLLETSFLVPWDDNKGLSSYWGKKKPKQIYKNHFTSAIVLATWKFASVIRPTISMFTFESIVKQKLKHRQKLLTKDSSKQSSYPSNHRAKQEQWAARDYDVITKSTFLVFEQINLVISSFTYLLFIILSYAIYKLILALVWFRYGNSTLDCK